MYHKHICLYMNTLTRRKMMSDFMSAMKDVLDDRKQLTENGAVGYSTTGKELLDFYFAVGSMRNWNESRIEDAFARAYFENPILAIKLAFFVRDREAIGERRVGRVIFNWLANHQADKMVKVLDLIPVYGRYDDLCALFGTSVTDDVVKVIAKQLTEDADNCVAGRPISLLAKWLPSENASSKATRNNARFITTKLGISPKQYRQTLSKLRKYLNVVETKISANNWSEVNYEAVPSKANLLYKDAFLKHDEERRREYLNSLQSGEVKINASVAFPYDIVNKYKYVRGVDTTLEEMWKVLPDYVNGAENVLMVRDGSGSMQWANLGNTKVTPLDVATSLSIYFAEKCSGAFHDKFITFSSSPQIVDMKNCETLRDKLELCKRHSDCSNTNIEATFDLILNAAIKNNMTQEEMPGTVLIVSDMEFDGATYGRCNATLFETISDKFAEHGYRLPKLVFWNVCSRTNTIPVKANESGVLLVSGFSPAVCKMVLSNELDPYKALLEQLNSPKYNVIEERLK